MVQPVTDPDTLAQLNGALGPSGNVLVPVTDPTTLAQLKAYGVGTDIAKSAGTGLRDATEAFLGASGDAANLGRTFGKWAGEKIAGPMDEKTSAALEAYNPRDPFNLGERLFGVRMPQPPTSQDAESALSGAMGDKYQPETTPGNYSRRIASFIPSAMAAGPGGAVSNAVRYGVIPGAAAEATSEATNNNPYATLAATVAAGGLAGPRGLSPSRARAVQTLEQEGVPLTAGDRTGNATLRATESELSPGVNEAQFKAFTQAAFRRVGENIGDRDLQGPQGAVSTMMQRIGGQYDGLATRNTAVPDGQLIHDLQTTHKTYNGTPGLYSSDTTGAVNGAINRVLNVIQSNGGVIPGNQYQTLRSNLRAAVMGASDPQRARALNEVVEHLDDNMERSIAANNPADAGAWGEARQQYRDALVLQHAAGAAGPLPAQGMITPANLASSAKSIYGRNAYVRGQDNFSDLADAGRVTMSAFPDSGTPRRQVIEKAVSGGTAALGMALGGGGGLAAGHQFGSPVEGLLLGEAMGPFVGRPLARGAVMNPVSQALLGRALQPSQLTPQQRAIAKALAVYQQNQPGQSANQAPAPVQ